MGQIYDTVSVYERLSAKKYKITIENGIEFVLCFDVTRYHHLVGYHYLTDLSGIAAPPHGKARFYRRLKNHRITEEEILKSAHFEHISERIAFFAYIEEIVAATECKIIVEFDKQKAGSDIEAKFFLYKRDGNPLNGESVTYYSLFIGYDAEENAYFPATYVVEHSVKYINQQTMLNCKIELLP